MKTKSKKSVITRLKTDWQLYILILPTLIMYIVFNYIPMYGIQIAFKNFRAVDGIWGSKWVGLYQFELFFSTFYWQRLLTNTFLLNFYSLLISFPIPIVLAILLNRIGRNSVKRFTQTAIYVPNFISVMVLVGMINIFFSPSNGLVNTVIRSLGFEKIDFMTSTRWFRTIYIGSGVWQGAGWGTILYLAALTGIDPELYEAATIDGASVIQKIRYIDFPMLIPVITMSLILSCGGLLGSDTMKVYLLQTKGNVPVSDIIGVYVLNFGLLGQGSAAPKFSYTAAIGLLTNVINFFIIYAANFTAKKLSGTSMF